ncbi:MAG TPA: hypothetical protein VG889_06680 [Rhizomicrobium sp.]|nr:hypothetical protein [Rhizomicrobium sp.]
MSMRFIIAIAMLAAIAAASGAQAGGRGHAIGLGAVLTSKDGGQIFGYDIDRDGKDGVLASAQTVDADGNELVSVETFNQDNGKITRSFAKHLGHRHEYGVDGIFAGDVALITHFVTPKGSIFPKREYLVMNPVTGKAFTGDWTPPLKDIQVEQASTDQDSRTAAILAIELKKDDRPVLIVTDVAANTFSKIVHLNEDTFQLANGPLLGQFTAQNKAVFALSPDAGGVGGTAPENIVIDMATGETKQFPGYNGGVFGAGFVNGLAVDPVTGIGATTTELNAQVEFYDMGARKPVAFAQLPCTGDTSQGNSGAGIAVDPVNKLFLVTEYFYCDGSQGSAIVVYDEAGNFVETITGFKFAVNEPPPVLNPSKRMGWAYGGPNGFSQLQQFFY